jgi:hypothetical protein
MQGSAMMYVTQATLAKRSLRRCQLLDELVDTLDERRLHDHLVEPGGVSGPQAGRVGVVRVAEDRNVGVRIGDLLGIDTGNIDDHEVRRIGVIDRDETMLGQERLQFPPEEEIDPTQQDRRHERKVRSHA